MRLVVYYDRDLKRYGFCSEQRMQMHPHEDEEPILITTSEKIARSVMDTMNGKGEAK